ncbi:hypothetical protein [Streptomyces sp. NPDC050287]|uniref:hypothetical protein n=1 Tax=Streptomyces sp. NPDC050287 TaxID=3365608 RepID=UPI00378CA8B0
MLLAGGLYTRVRRQWGLTDFTVLGAALGAGFGLLEALLRYSLDADRALSRHGGWLIPDSLSPPYVPGWGEVATSWLPSPAATLHLGRTGDATVATFTHLRGRPWQAWRSASCGKPAAGGNPWGCSPSPRRWPTTR